MESIFTKQKSIEAKGMCIIVMMIHHLFAFPDRLDYLFDNRYLVRLGQECGIVVGLYVFISGYGLALTHLSVKTLLRKIWSLWKNYSYIFFIFVPIGFLLGVYKFDFIEFLSNLFFVKSSYNHEWWFLGLYVKLILLSYLLKQVKNNVVLCILSTILMIMPVLFRVSDFEILPLDLSIYLPVFMLSFSVSRLSLFERVGSLCCYCIHGNFLRVLCCLLIAFYIGHCFIGFKFLQYFFWFLAFSLIKFPDRFSSLLRFLARHSINMWLIHTFYCYYFFKCFFVAVSNPMIAFILLLAISLVTSILIERIKNLISCLKTYFL